MSFWVCRCIVLLEFWVRRTFVFKGDGRRGDRRVGTHKRVRKEDMSRNRISGAVALNTAPTVWVEQRHLSRYPCILHTCMYMCMCACGSCPPFEA